ncbi:hypothetical protein VIGAN_11242100, partial [Vigna angularis var. angularis]
LQLGIGHLDLQLKTGHLDQRFRLICLNLQSNLSHLDLHLMPTRIELRSSQPISTFDLDLDWPVSTFDPRWVISTFDLS